MNGTCCDKAEENRDQQGHPTYAERVHDADCPTHLMTNDHTDQFHVSMVAKVNVVAGWSCRTREDAEKSAKAMLARTPDWSGYRIKEGRRR